MLITRKSPKRKPSNPFRSRFEEADAFPMRQYLRLRDEVVQKVLLALIQALFSIALFIFAQRVYKAFVRHGQGVAPWLKWGSISLIALFALVMLIRSARNMLSVRALREEMRDYRMSTTNDTQ